jgi:hypothetical protein
MDIETIGRDHGSAILGASRGKQFVHHPRSRDSKEKRIYNESTLSVLALTLTLEGELAGVSNWIGNIGSWSDISHPALAWLHAAVGKTRNTHPFKLLGNGVRQEEREGDSARVQSQEQKLSNEEGQVAVGLL